MNLKTLEWGNKSQALMIEKLKESEVIATGYTRDRSERYYDRNFPEIMFRRFNYEETKWTCPLCSVDNYVRVDNYQTLPPIITPRVYFCHNSQCELRRFYWRDSNNVLFARYLGKYECIDELEFASAHDPWKFYDKLKPFTDPKQISMF